MAWPVAGSLDNTRYFYTFKYFPVPEHEVEDAAGEAGVEREVVRQPGEVVGLVAAQEELPVHVEVGQLACRHRA